MIGNSCIPMVFTLSSSSGVSFVFLFIFQSKYLVSGIIIYFFLMGTAFVGYVSPLGQMSL